MLSSLNEEKPKAISAKAKQSESIHIKVALEDLAVIQAGKERLKPEPVFCQVVELPEKVPLLSCTVNKQTLVWIASLTEMVNASYGYPESAMVKHQKLTLLLDHGTFDEFRVRFSSSSSHLLLPNSTQVLIVHQGHLDEITQNLLAA